MSQLTVVQNSLPANIEDEADALLASTQTHEKLLKFKKGKFFAMDNEVALGTEFLCHASQLVIGWIKFVNNKVADRKMGRAAEGFVPPKREELGDNDQSQWERDDRGAPKDPWTFQHLMPFENLETGELMIFTTSSIGGQIATQNLVREYAQRVKRKGSRALPIIKLDVAQMRTKSFGDVARPHFEVTGWEDAPAVSPANVTRTVNVDDVPDLDPPPHDDMRAWWRCGRRPRPGSWPRPQQDRSLAVH